MSSCSKRRCSSQALPLLLLCIAMLCSGCGDSGEPLYSVWGPISTGEDPTDVNYLWGGTFEVSAFAHEATVSSADGSSRDYLEVVLLSAEQPVSCEAYTDYLASIQSIQAYVDELEAAVTEAVPLAADWHEYVCQQSHGAALRAFGGDSSYRALHSLVLVDPNNPNQAPVSGLFSPRQTTASELSGGASLFFGAEAFAELPGANVQDPMWTYVTRTYERSSHGRDILPEQTSALWQADDPDPISWCGSLLGHFAEEEAASFHSYPDTAAKVLQASTHRYYHRYTTQAGLAVGSALEEVPIGLTLPGWSEVATAGGELGITIVGRVSRAPEGMPYENIVLTSRSERIPVQVCPELSPYLRTVWPELL